MRAAAFLRAPRVFLAVRAALGRASSDRFRVLEFSVQRGHLHLLVEADDERAIARGMQGLGVRVARAVNRAIRRRGHVWADRYHARALASPRAVRNVLVYVLHNARKHRVSRAWIDRCSSAPWFDGFVDDDVATWSRAPRAPPPAEQRPTVAPRTWLASTGWRRLGLIALHESPAPSRDARSIAARAAPRAATPASPGRGRRGAPRPRRRPQEEPPPR